MAKSIQDAKALVEQHPICDLITIDENCFPVERAMFTPKVDDDFTVYFGTFAGSNKCRQIKANPGVVVVWTTGKGYVSLRGKAEYLDDQASREHAWHPIFATHFPGGSADPTYCVIRISPVSLTSYEEGATEAETISLGW